jgi:glutathione S-transferase
VRLFLAEKGVTLPTIHVDLPGGEHFGAAFRAINPEGTVPVLELDGGIRIFDPIGICRYFEHTHPDPPLMGRTATEKALIEQWHRWAEREGFYAMMDAFRNMVPRMKGRALPGPDNYEQIPALAERGKARVLRYYKRLDEILADRPYMAGSTFSLADISAVAAVDFARREGLEPAAGATHLHDWFERVSARPAYQTQPALVSIDMLTTEPRK